MKKRSAFMVLLIGLLLILVSSTASTSKTILTGTGFQQSEETDELIKLIESSYQIEAQAGRDFDISGFKNIFINDSRGGALAESTMNFIKSVDPDSFKDSYGYLDYKIAYYKWWKDGALKIETILESIKNKDRRMSESEIQFLLDVNGRTSMPRLKGEIISNALSFTSIHINGDIATVIFDDGPRTNQMTLVKVDHEWFIAGNKILSVHP